MKQISLTMTGADIMQKHVQMLAAQVPHAVAAALTVEAELTMTEAKELCPVDTGALRSSGLAEPPVIAGRSISVTLGFGGPAAPYALSVHENPRAGQTMGRSPSGATYQHYSRVGQWKFLEMPVLARTRGFVTRIRDRALAYAAGKV